MLQLRCLAPLSFQSSQWQLQAVLRLPPELRHLALRPFSTLNSPLSHPQNGSQDDNPDEGGHIRTSLQKRDGRVSKNTLPPSKTEERKHKRGHKIETRVQSINAGHQQLSSVSIGDRKINGMHSTNTTISRDGKNREGTTNAGKARTNRTKNSQGRDPGTHPRRSPSRQISNSNGLNNKSGSQLFSGHAEAKARPRLPTRPKDKLLKNSNGVSDAPATRKRSRPLKDASSGSAESWLDDQGPAKTSMVKNESFQKKTPPLRRPTSKQRPHFPSKRTEDQSALATSNQQLPSGPEVADNDAESKDSKPSPLTTEFADGSGPVHAHNKHLDTFPDASILSDLKRQIEELTSLLKAQAAQQRQTQSGGALSQVIEKASDLVAKLRHSDTQESTVEAGDRRYQATRKEHEKNASLPHGDEFKVGQDAVNQSTELSKPEGGLVKVREATNDGVESARSTTSTNDDDVGSLYEQLFPEESQPYQHRPSADAEVPRVPISDVADPALSPSAKPRAQPKSEQLASLYDAQQDRTKTVLVLRGASKSLTEDDFRRAVPRGKHIQEWTLRGEYERVIPVRDFWTLERTGDYYIVFKYAAAAEAFLQHARRVFSLMSAHTPDSLLSPLRPAPRGLLGDEIEDEVQLVRNFTLFTPSMGFPLERARKGIKSEVLRRGGYPQALSGSLTPETPQVLLEMDGGNMPNWFQVRDAIARDGNRRGTPWTLLPGELGIRRLEMKRPGSEDSGADGRDGEHDGDVDDAVLLAQDRVRQGRNGQRWLVAFTERHEAQRFARTWHMRPFPWVDAELRRDLIYKGVTRVKAELLW
ncbi:uncharacterized protein PV09_08602 [Verruconis gallopava]|uniref:Uncharacterized protein n=1 Tax=Verruconis gallopava TaxID=253628 RepID=A0A0D1ZZC9_9PEZI|nr:uncharacterized protein PV09_08602 [Verruconis gallopava]KIV99797.1 hypothetical protein PV09_08602 [Verruconis gallopava]